MIPVPHRRSEIKGITSEILAAPELSQTPRLEASD